jgi:integrin beta 3
MAALEGRIQQFAYRGVWETGTVYRQHNSVTDGGSLWICVSEQTVQRPGDGQNWRLAVKRGKDGRDARP